MALVISSWKNITPYAFECGEAAPAMSDVRTLDIQVHICTSAHKPVRVYTPATMRARLDEVNATTTFGVV